MFVAPLIKERTTQTFFGFDCHMLCEIPVLRLVVAAHVWAPQLLDQDPDDADEEDKVHLRERKREEMAAGFVVGLPTGGFPTHTDAKSFAHQTKM